MWKRRIRVVSLVALGAVIGVLLMFRGDYRIFSGFDEMASSSRTARLYFRTGDPKFIDDNEVDRVLTSKMSSRTFMGGNPWVEQGTGASEGCYGPTLIVMKSGRIVVTGGAVVHFNQKEERSIVIPQ